MLVLLPLLHQQLAQWSKLLNLLSYRPLMKRSWTRLGKADSPVNYHADVSYRDWFGDNIIDSMQHSTHSYMWISHQLYSDITWTTTRQNNYVFCCYASLWCLKHTIQLLYSLHHAVPGWQVHVNLATCSSTRLGGFQIIAVTYTL